MSLSPKVVKAIALSVAGGAILVSSYLGASILSAPAPPPAAMSAEPEPAPTPEPVSQKEQLRSQLDAADLSGALALLATSFEPAQRDELDPASAALALWSHQHLTWPTLAARPQTKRALVMKDPEAELGKSLCWSGTVSEIHTDRSAGYPIFHGGIVDYNVDVVRFYAVGSSGSLVENSQARICGIVTGVVSYSNSGGGTTHAPRVVGMFDLPANRRGFAPASAR